MSIGDWLSGVAKNKMAGGRPVSTPQFEQLEPRLLLSGDFVEMESALVPDIHCAGQAIFLDLEEESASSQADSSVATVELDEPLSSDLTIAPSPVGAEDGAPGETSGPVETGAALDMSTGAETAVMEGKCLRVACLTETKGVDPAAVSLTGSAGPTGSHQPGSPHFPSGPW